MSTKSEPFSSWLKQIPGDLYNLDEKPLLGFPPVFPWENFSADLANSLQTKDLSITPGNLQWLSETELFNGLGDRLKALTMTVSPLAGPVWWIMPERALAILMRSLLKQDPNTTTETLDENFSKAFFQFLAAEAINSFSKIEFDKKLAPSVLKESTLPTESCLSLDVSIKLGNETVHGRLLLSQEFRKSIAHRFSKDQKELALSSPLSDTLNVIVHLEAGKLNITPSEWKQIVPGDFVVLDNCSLDPNEDKGRVMLVINGTPFFRAKIKQGSLKILEHPLYHEVDTPMGTPPKNNPKDNEAFDDSDLDDSDFDIEDTEEHTEIEHDETHDDLLDEDLDISDEDLEKSGEAKTEKPAKPMEKPAEAPKAAPTQASQTPLSVEEIPLTIVIEVGRIQMSVKKLLELQPGNMLDLNIHPESGVDLVINGKRIARGELLKIGDALGVRISELS